MSDVNVIAVPIISHFDVEVCCKDILVSKVACDVLL
jgi:hypothetical protein